MNQENVASSILELSPEQKIQFDADVAALKAYGEAHKLYQLEGRVNHGLDPSGMLAVPETRALAESIATRLGTTVEAVEGFISELHTQGPWKNAEKLKNGGNSPESRFYLSLAGVCEEKPDANGMTPTDYLNDRSRVVSELNVLGGNDAAKAEELFKNHLESRVYRMKDKKVLDVDGVKVPIAQGDIFIGLAAEGYTGGISKTGEDSNPKTMYFIGTESFSPETIQSIGMVPAFAELYNPDTQSMDRVEVDSEDAKRGRLVYTKADQLEQPLKERVGELKRINAGYYLAFHNEDLAVKLLATELKNRAEK
ncbi:hypothetical protein KBC54_03925 [Patescibacteria group bacterium]|nr:hypothetical protein [Patescibacteria group bacterium]